MELSSIQRWKSVRQSHQVAAQPFVVQRGDRRDRARWQADAGSADAGARTNAANDGANASATDAGADASACLCACVDTQLQFEHRHEPGRLLLRRHCLSMGVRRQRLHEQLQRQVL